MKYKIIILCGKAGSGKDTILKKVVADCPQLHEIVSYTTRPIRQNEIDGINYHYITEEQFKKKILSKEMLETSNFNNWFYGTAYDSLKTDSINIGIFNPEGIYSLLKHNDIEPLIFFITADDKIRLLRQLNREDSPDVEEIVRRFNTDKNDFLNLNFDYYCLVNNKEEDLNFCTEIIKNLGLKRIKQIK